MKNRLVPSLLIGFSLLTLVSAKTAAAWPWSSKFCNHGSENGITVEPAKLFDVRELEAMLRARQSELETIKTFQGDRLLASTGLFQGSEQTSTAVGVHAAELATPASATPTIPTAPTPGTITPPADLKFGITSRDLLAEQLSFGYEVVNLQLLLNQAVSDRIEVRKNKDTGDLDLLGHRDQALLGFHIDVLPQRRDRRAAAEVEVIIRHSPTCSCGLSDVELPHIVGLFPEKNTYNVQSITNNIANIGLGAIVGVFDVGLSATRAKNAFYIVRDVDTVAFRGPVRTKEISLGWQFRPVLGRTYVEPGPRQVYALLALPEGFTTADGKMLSHEFTSEIRTRWRGLQQSDQAMDLGEFFPDCRKDPLQLPNKAVLERATEAHPFEVEWEEIQAGRALVHVEGEGFGPDTAVSLVSRKLGPDDQLRISTDHQLSFQVSLKDLTGFFQISNRFGEPRPLENPFCIPDPRVTTLTCLDSGTSFESVGLTPLDSERALLTLQGVCGLLRAGRRHPVVEIGGEVFSKLTVEQEREACPPLLPPGSPTSAPPIQKTRITTVVPIDLLAKNSEVRLVEPFFPAALSFRKKYDLGDLFVAEPPVTIVKGAKQRIAIRGHNLVKATVMIGSDSIKDFLPGSGPELILLDVDSPKLDGVNQIVVTQGAAPARFLAVTPPEKEPDLKLASDIRQGESVEVAITGGLAKDVQKILFEENELKLRKDEGKTLVRLTELVTGKSGRRDLTVQLKPEKEGDPPRVRKLELKVLPLEKTIASTGF
jgi:hypothetical protein